jgi:hypothetical protein
MKYIALILVLALPLAAIAGFIKGGKGSCSAVSNPFCKNR